MIRISLALLAAVLTGAQALLIFFTGQGVCLNDGCNVVERLTTVSQLYFNLAGCCFFLLIGWALFLGRKEFDFWDRFARLLLLGGIVAEAVLIFFQYRIAMAFCSYCLIVFSFILLLNVMSGARQIFRGIILFSSVMVACLSLQFTGSGNAEPLEKGAVATLRSDTGFEQLYLFFSRTCEHCEKVIGSLREGEDVDCNISFNPVERFDEFYFEGTEKNKSYDPGVNLGFMKSLGLTGIPVLVAKEAEQIKILDGERQISEYLDFVCRHADKKEVAEPDYSGSSSVAPTDFTNFNSFKQEDDSCKVGTDC